MTDYEVHLSFSLPADIDAVHIIAWLSRVIEKAGGILLAVVRVQKKQH